MEGRCRGLWEPCLGVGVGASPSFLVFSFICVVYFVFALISIVVTITQECPPDTLVLSSEVLVLDVALLPEPTVHASYAGSTAEGHHCPAMDVEMD